MPAGRRWATAGAGAAALLAGCAAAPPESARAVAAPPAAVAGRVAGALADLRLVPRPAAAGRGGVTAAIANVPTAWAECRPMLVGDSDDRFRMVTAGARHGSVAVSVEAAPASGETRVRVSPSFAATYRNTINGTSFDARCESTGVLERRLLAAAAG